VRVGNVDLDPGIGGQGFVQGHLLDAVIGHAESLLRFDAAKRAGRSILLSKLW
jgi:hypothetical protein